MNIMTTEQPDGHGPMKSVINAKSKTRACFSHEDALTQNGLLRTKIIKGDGKGKAGFQGGRSSLFRTVASVTVGNTQQWWALLGLTRQVPLPCPPTARSEPTATSTATWSRCGDRMQMGPDSREIELGLGRECGCWRLCRTTRHAHRMPASGPAG